jgi:hypothetical protein
MSRRAPRLWWAPLALTMPALLACSGVVNTLRGGEAPATTPAAAPASGAPTSDGGGPGAAAPGSTGIQAPQVTGGHMDPVQLDGPGAGTGPACDTDLKVPPADCAIAVIGCGAVVQASNAGQGKRFDDRFTTAKYCTPQRHHYGDSPEAVWALDIPEDTKVDVVLRTDCADLDLFSIRWPEASSCPSAGRQTGECEASTKRGDDTVRITTVGREERHLIWVDGKDGAVGNFKIEVRCGEYR